MVTFTKRYESFTVGKVYCDGDCLSTDTKPTNGIANGSKLYEMDTGKKYMFDEENLTWLEVSNGEGGGSSSGGGSVFEMVYVDSDSDPHYESVDSTETILAAFKAGKHTVLHFEECERWTCIECYATIVGYDCPYEDSDTEKVYVAPYTSVIGQYVQIGLTSVENGKLYVPIYVE